MILGMSGREPACRLNNPIGEPQGDCARKHNHILMRSKDGLVRNLRAQKLVREYFNKQAHSRVYLD
jgi:hypothetical protein